jgi:hypothetical protein
MLATAERRLLDLTKSVTRRLPARTAIAPEGLERGSRRSERFVLDEAPRLRLDPIRSF